MEFVKKYQRWIVSLLLLWVAGVGIFQARYHSLTSDEAVHTASAYTALTRGDHRFDPEHPFLFKYLTAVPLLFVHLNNPPDDAQLWKQAEPTLFDTWQPARTWSDEWLYTSGNNAIEMQLLMRIPGIVLSVVLVWFVWWLTHRWFGEMAAFWALLLTAFNPTLLGHAFTTNTDVPLAFTFLVALWRLYEYWQKPSNTTAAWAGVAMAVALVTKFSAIAIVPVALIWLIGTAWNRHMKAREVLLHGLIATVIIFVIIWVTYFFQSPVHIQPGDVAATEGILHMHNINISLGSFSFLQYVLPSAFLKGLYLVTTAGTDGRATFLLNTHYGSGVWFYFPVLYFLKSQFIIVIFTAVALGFGAAKLKSYKNWSAISWILLLGGSIFLGLALKSKLNLGIRHISPLFPILSIALGAFIVHLKPLVRRPILSSIFIIILIILPVTLQMKNLLGFGNILTGDPSEKFRYFEDSNLDWGQSNEQIAQLLAREFPGEPVYAARTEMAQTYFGIKDIEDIHNAGSKGKGAILLTAIDMNSLEYGRYAQYKPAFIVDDAYFIFRSDKLVPR